MFPRYKARLLPVAAVAAAFLLTGCAGPPATPPPPQGATYTTASGATITVSGRVAAEGVVAR